jgi:hypothetical protein
MRRIVRFLVHKLTSRTKKKKKKKKNRFFFVCVQRQIRRVVAAVGGTMNGGDNDHDDDDEDDAIVDVDGDDDDDDDERSHDDDDVHTSGSSGANRSGDDDDDDDGDGDDNSDSIQIDDERADRHHRADRSTRGAASARVRRSTRKSTPVVRKSTSRHPHSVSAAATPSTAVAKSPDSADAAHGAAVVPRKRGRPPRVPRKEDANGDVVGAVEPASTDEHTTSPLPVGDSDAHSAKRTRIGTATSARPRTRRSERATSAHQRRGAAVDDDVQDDDEDQIDEFDDGDDDDNDENDDDDDDDDDDESVNMHLKKSLRGVAVSTRSLRGAHSKADDSVQSPARGSQRGTRSGAGGAAVATAAAAAAATSSTTNVADAIGNRTRSARGTLPPPQSQNGDTVGAQRAFVTQDSGPMASRISALPTGLVDARMYELDLNEIDMDRRVHLSRGAVSDVYKVRWCGVSAVLKQWHPSCDAERFKNEVDITRLCQFPRVVQLYGASLSQKVMLFERLGRGNLRQVLTSEKYTLASIERHLRTWALEVAEAMAFVHANGVIHYDLKSQNVLVTMSWNTRLCDFSHSVYVGTTPPATGGGGEEWGQIGSLEITAPEVFTQRQRTPKSDVYSFGLLLWEMLSYGETPFLQYSTDARALQTYVCAPVNGRPPLKSTWDPRVKDIMRRAWHLDPNQRPTFNQLVTMLSSNVRAQNRD